MKIEWAPVKIPPRRRLQTLAAGIYVFIFLSVPFLALITTISLLIWGSWVLRTLTVLYLSYIYYDVKYRNSVLNGNGWLFLRTNILSKNLRDYFPIELIKTAELKPDKNYIIASFPHGVLGTGISCNMGNEVSRWMKLYPGIRPKLATLNINFYIPFLRDLIRLWGMVQVSKESLIYFLTKSNDPKHKDNRDGFTSNAVAILVGGAQEALDTNPGRYVLTLKNRKGFVKIAIRTGSAIVPSFSFGEVEIFEQVANPPDSWLRQFQSLIKKVTGISPLVVKGRGFFQYTFGIIPRRNHIVQVVGAPIIVKKSDNPDPAYVEEIHQKVIDDLIAIFEKYKGKYIQNSEEVKLIIN